MFNFLQKVRYGNVKTKCYLKRQTRKKLEKNAYPIMNLKRKNVNIIFRENIEVDTIKKG